MEPVKLQDIVGEMEMQSDDWQKFLNTETGMIITIDSEGLNIADQSDEDDDFSEYPDWQRDSISDAQDVLMNWGNGKYIKLPDQWDIHEYQIMASFCDSLNDRSVSDKLYSAIQGRGAFRRFKDTVFSLGVEDAWYQFRDKTYRELAVRWCEDHRITYE